MTMVPEIMDMVLPMEGVFHNLVIVKIKKEYPGKALKVMNSLWGAGQMMFTKMMIIVDGDVNIHDNLAIARHISAHVDPETDILFTKGPMDILDHACSQPSFGGKMGIDDTSKLEEERRVSGEKPLTQLFAASRKPDINALYPDFTDLTDTLLKNG